MKYTRLQSQNIPNADENDDGNSCIFPLVNLDDFRPIYGYKLYMHEEIRWDNKSVGGGHYAYIIDVAREGI